MAAIAPSTIGLAFAKRRAREARVFFPRTFSQRFRRIQTILFQPATLGRYASHGASRYPIAKASARTGANAKDARYASSIPARPPEEVSGGNIRPPISHICFLFKRLLKNTFFVRTGRQRSIIFLLHFSIEHFLSSLFSICFSKDVNSLIFKRSS